MSHFFILLARVVIAHAVADFGLQSQAMADGKNRHTWPPPGYNPLLHGDAQTMWPYFLTSHAIIYAGAMWVALGTEWGALALVLGGFHWVVDYMKCERVYGIHMDQLLHLGYALMAAFLVAVL